MSLHQGPLTPSDIADLRASARLVPRYLIGSEALPACIHWLPTLGQFVLATSGRPVAASSSLRVLSTILRAEATEPGYLARIMDPSADPETASLALDPYNLARVRAQANALAIQARTEADDAKARAERRASQIDVSKLSLDDL